MTHALPSPVPGWRITEHARARAAERGICDRDLRLTVEEPWCSYPQTDTYGADRQVRVRGEWAVVVNPAARTLITVLFSSRARTLTTVMNRTDHPIGAFLREIGSVGAKALPHFDAHPLLPPAQELSVGEHAIIDTAFG